MKNYLKFIIYIYILLILVGCSNTENSNESNDTGTNNNFSNSLVENWDDYTIIVDGSKINLPMKFSEFENLGFHEMNTYNGSVLDDIIEPNSSSGSTYNSNLGSYYGLFTNDKTNNIYLILYNDTDENKKLRDCYIVGIGFEQSNRNLDGFTFGDVRVLNNTKKLEAVIGVSTYDEIESSWGLHYEYNRSNELTYQPDLNGDGIIYNDANSDYLLNFYFDSNTMILDPYEFQYYVVGMLKQN